MRFTGIVPILLGLALIGHGAEPTTRPTTAAWRDSILKLIDDLEAPAFADREAAQAKLIDIGPDVLGPLNARLAQGGTGEMYQRAKAVTVAISRKWKFVSAEGGSVSGGFQATLQKTRETYAANGPILLNVVLCNVSPKNRQMADLRGWDVELVDPPKLFLSRNADARVVIRKVADAQLPNEAKPQIFSDAPEEKRGFPPGANISTLIALHQGVKLAPGEYDVEYILYTSSKNLVDGAFEDLHSNVLRIKVER